MNRGVEIDAEAADRPGRSSPRRSPTASPCGWRCCTSSSARATEPASVDAGGAAVTLADHGRPGRDGHRRRGRAPGRRRSSADGGRSPRSATNVERRPGVHGPRRRRGCVVAPRPRRPAHPPARARRRGGRDLETGSRAAALGGYTARGRHAQHRARRSTTPAVVAPGARARSAGAVRRARSPARSPSGRAGEQLAPMAELAGLGVRLFTDDGAGVQDARPHAPGARVRRAASASPSPSTARTPPWPAAATCTRARGRAGSASPASRPRPRS